MVDSQISCWSGNKLTVYFRLMTFIIKVFPKEMLSYIAMVLRAWLSWDWAGERQGWWNKGKGKEEWKSLYIGRRALQPHLWALCRCIASAQQQLWPVNIWSLLGKGVKEHSSFQGREDSYTPIPTGMALVKLSGSQRKNQDMKATGGPSGRRGRRNECEQNMLYTCMKLSRNKLIKNKRSCS